MSYVIASAAYSWGGGDSISEAVDNWIKEVSVPKKVGQINLQVSVITSETELSYNNCQVNELGNIIHPKGAEVRTITQVVTTSTLQKCKDMLVRLDRITDKIKNPLYDTYYEGKGG